MNPIIQLLLIFPLIVLGCAIYLLRVKNRLENHTYKYRPEGIILQTSLTIFRINRGSGKNRLSLGLVVLTHGRIVILNWREKVVFNCDFASRTKEGCSASVHREGKSIAIVKKSGDGNISIEVNVRNPEAWITELKRLLSHSLSE
jgi:hypothetical protein